MKNPILKCTPLFFLLLLITSRTFGDESTTLINHKVPENLLVKYDSEFAKKHPEHGILPFNAPCTDCIEILEKRTPNRREYIGQNDGKGSRAFYVQQSFGNMSFQDKDGFLVTKDPRLMKESEFVFAARQQPTPVVVDFKNRWASITNGTKEFRFNKNISLVLISVKGETQNFGEGNWSRVVKTDNFTETTLTVQEFYPGIDLQMTAALGRMKTNFIIKSRLVIDPRFVDGWLAMTQDIEMPDGFTADLSESIENAEHRRLGNLNVLDEKLNKAFYFSKSYAFDARGNQNYLEMPFTLDGTRIDYYVPVNWLNSQSTIYPVTVDPFVYSGDTLLKSSILGSGFTGVCGPVIFGGGCSYYLNNVMTPPNCEITQINTYYSYIASMPCVRTDGGFDITMFNPSGDSCVSSNFSCPGGIQGQCFFWPAQIYNSTSAFTTFGPCLLPPQCAPYDLDFKMLFRRCNWIPVAGCDSTCISANSEWIINIQGRTVELTNVSLPQTICEGQCTDLAAAADWGVPLVVGTNNYTFTWNGTLVGDLVNVCPVTTTNYEVIVTDLCGMSDTGSTSVTVIPLQNPGFTIGPNDTVCTNTPMTFTGLGGGAANSYDWSISCPNQSDFNDIQILNWTSPATTGTCTAELTYSVFSGNLTCTLAVSQTFVVEPGSPPIANITYVPGSLCPGAAVTFTANGSNWGGSPTFQWYLDGTLVAGATNSTWNTTSPGSQFTVSVFVTSNSTCANPDTVTAGVVVPVSNSVVPTVVATAAPNSICPGDPVTFTAVPGNGGSSPTYQWLLNGNPIAGATDSTYTTNPGTGDIYEVVMTSNSPCVNPPTASDTETVAIANNVVPSVAVVADQPNEICAGTQVTFTANAANGGAPSYQWQLDGVDIGGATNSTYTTTPPAGSGIYGVIIISSLTCSNPNNANDTMLMTVVPTVAPAVSITTTVDTVCSGDPLVFTAHAVTAGSNPTYAWTVDGSSAGGNYDTLNVNSPASSYVVSVTITSNAQCPSPTTATNTYNIFVRPTPVPDVTITLSDDSVCAGTPVSFTANPTNPGTAPTYQWYLNNNPIAGETNITYNTTPVNSTDVYSVTMTSNELCVSPPTATEVANIVVTPNAVPDVTVASNVGQVVCDNTPMTFTATPTNGGNNPGFQWLLNGAPIGGATNSTYSPPLSVIDGSIFECVLTTSLECAIPVSDNDTLQMTILPLVATVVSLTSTDDTICEGTPVTFTASPTNGGTDPIYAWTIDGVAVAGNDTDFLSSSTMTNGAVVGVTLTSNIPCSSPSNTTFTIFVTPTPVPQITQTSFPPSVCAGDVLTFNAVGVNGGTAPQYQWYVNGIAVGGATSDTYSSVLNDGDIVTVELTSNAPCANPVSATSNQIVAVVIPYVTPGVSITSSMVNDSICLGQNVIFTASGQNGGSTPFYTWYVNGVDQGVNGPIFSSSLLIQNDIVSVMLTSSEPCLTQPSANSNIILVNVFPPLNVLALGDAIICPYEPVTLSAYPGGGDGGPYTFNWSHNAGTDQTVIVTPGVTTQYSVTILDVCGSAPVSDSVLVTVNPSPEADLTFDPPDPSSLAPDVNFFDESLNPITWQWSFGDGDSSVVEDPFHTYQSPGEYDVTLVVTNIYGCIDSITYKVIVKEDISVFIPNSFTPNNDGVNEFFIPMGVSLEDFDFWIFNRWGDEIFHGNEETPWLGDCDRTGQPAPEDVYVYKVDLKYPKFGERYVTGKVSLVY